MARHLGVPSCMFLSRGMLQGPRVVAVVGELEPTGMAKHVWVDWEWHLGRLADALDEVVIGPPRSERTRRRPWDNRAVACAAPASRHRGSDARWQGSEACRQREQSNQFCGHLRYE